MNKLFGIAALCVMLFLVAAPVLAQEKTAAPSDASKVDAEKTAEAEAAKAVPWLSILSGTAFGAGLIIVGAGYGISKIGACAVESMARQPEVANSIQTAMIISAALIEGATFFALIVCMMA